MNIAIIEHENDINNALRHFQAGKCLFVSVSAEASYYLSKNNITFVTDEDVLTPEDFKRLGEEDFEITEKWIQRLEEILGKLNPSFKGNGFAPFKWHYYRMKILVDAVRIKKAILDRLFTMENPSLVGAPYSTDPARIQDHHLFFYNNESLNGILAERIAAQRGVEIRRWKSISAYPRQTNPLKGIADFARGTKRAMKKISESLAFLTNGKDSILNGASGYDVAPLMQRLKNEYGFYRYENLLFSPLLDLMSWPKSKRRIEGFPKISMEGAFKHIAVTGDGIVDSILGDRVQAYVEQFLPTLWRGWQRMDLMDRIKNFKLYLHHAGASDSFCGLPLFYFERKGKPVVIVQHGAYGFALNRQTEYCEFGHSGHFFAWGDGVKETYEHRKKGQCQIHSIGSSLIEQVRARRTLRKKIRDICYVPHAYSGYAAYYPNGQPCLDSKVFVNETSFLLAIKPFMDTYRITYKMSPSGLDYSRLWGENMMPQWLKENMDAVKVVSKPLSLVIHDFDLFIIDWPSTTLIQALASGAEVLVYVGNPYFVITNEALALLRRRAIVATDKEDFKDKIKSVLDRGIVMSNTEDTLFLEKYGIHRDDGGSLERMVSQAEQILIGK
jgi:hypothetical protein